MDAILDTKVFRWWEKLDRIDLSLYPRIDSGHRSPHQFRAWVDAHVAEARRFDKPVYGWLSMQWRDEMSEWIEPVLFRQMLETCNELCDGTVVYWFGDDGQPSGTEHERIVKESS